MSICIMSIFRTSHSTSSWTVLLLNAVLCVSSWPPAASVAAAVAVVSAAVAAVGSYVHGEHTNGVREATYNAA